MNEQIDTNVEKLQPFTRILMTIGQLPTSYLMSMTYYEQLIWFTKYLQETVIPTINNNASAVEEVQQIVMNLQTYINNYFDNLDVQEEINNKLDEMAENGTLTTLISNYVNPYLTDFQDQINNIDTKVEAVASGSPLVASSTAGMTDTTRVYVNTTDGKWYYYDGDSWEIGGTYQSTGISDESITYKMLNDDLKNHIKIIIPEYTLTDGSYISSFGTIVSNQYSTNYSYSSPIEVHKNEKIKFHSGGTSSVASLIFCDENGNNRTVLELNSSTSGTNNSYTLNYDGYVILSSLTDQLYDVRIEKTLICEQDYPNLKTIYDENDAIILIDKNTTYTNTNKYVKYADGTLATLNNSNASDYIDILPNQPIKIICNNNFISSPDARGLAFYRKDKTFISGYQYPNDDEISTTTPNEAYYMRITQNPNYIYYGYNKSFKKVIENINNFEYAYNNYFNKDLFKSFLHVGVIGDSLASGESAYKSSGETHYVDIFNQSWCQYMARMSGNTYYNFSKGGLSTRTWLTNNTYGYPLASDGNHNCEAYIIALGENDWTIESYLGTSNDINLEDYTQNADSFYGNYAGIIQRMQILCPKAKFFLITMPTNSGTKANFNEAIRYMATIFNNIYILDLADENHIGYFSTNSFIDLNKRSGHFNAIAYNYIAQLFMNWLSKIMNDNIDDFRQVEFINTIYEWTN